MTAAEWLNHLASAAVARFPRGRTHLASFAPALAKDVPGRFLTAKTADAVERDLRSLPTYAELLLAVRRAGELAPSEPGADPDREESEEDIKNRLWLEFAHRRLADVGSGHLPHLLSLLKAYCDTAWWRFAEVHAPEQVRRERHFMARRQLLREGRHEEANELDRDFNAIDPDDAVSMRGMPSYRPGRVPVLPRAERSPEQQATAVEQPSAPPTPSPIPAEQRIAYHRERGNHAVADAIASHHGVDA